jgi:PAS domain S-box-containing protein
MAQSQPENMAELRRRAEKSLSRIVRESVPSLAPESVQRLVHKLRVHQIELELQCQELLRAQGEIEESRNRYRELYESIPLGYATIDCAGRLYDLNPAGHALLGVNANKDKPDNFFSFFPEDDAEAVTLFCRKALSEHAASSCESTMRRADATEFSAALQAAPAQSGSGKAERLRITFKDVTGRKEMEEALRQHEKELEANRIELQDLAGKLFSAQEEERRRIACDIHDDHCQRITALILETRSIAILLQQTLPSLVPRIESITARLNDMLDDFRHLAHGLHPRHLDTIPLASSMRTLIKEVMDYSALRIEFQEQDIPSRLPMPVTICLYRLLQECLSNIRKHADAVRVTVKLIGKAEGLEFFVQDDGKGFDMGRVAGNRRGMGLTSMQERLRPLGGTVSIVSGQGIGTQVSVFVPLHPERRSIL